MDVIPLTRKLWDFIVQADGGIASDLSRNYRHKVFMIMLKNRERYALDLTHAQFGHRNETLMPWRTYVDIRVQSIIGEHPLGWVQGESRRVM